MHQVESRKRVRLGRPSPAMIIAIIALIASLSGSAIAAKQKLGKNSVGSRQLKSKAVTTGKLANNAVNGKKVKNRSLTGADINLGALGTVPSATSAAQAGNANTVSGHPAACPPATTLIRGICYDSASNPPIKSVQEAANACAGKGGYLPTALQLYSTRGILNLGTGVGTDSQFTDTYYANTSGVNYRTIVINGTGAMTEQSFDTIAEYICAYPLVR